MLVGMRHLPRLFQRVLIGSAVLLALALVLATAGLAAPKADSPGECQVIATVALVSRALAISKIERARADAVLSQVFVGNTDDGASLIRRTVDAAFRSSATAKDFAEHLGAVCILRRGNVDEVLGIDS